VRALAAAGAGFLVAVLWFDLMFDVQVRGHGQGDLPEPVRRSISAYYARVTTGARPMNRLVTLMMLVTVGALVAVLVRADLPAWRVGLCLVLAVGAIGLAGMRTVPAAVRLGRGHDDAAEQSRLARAVLRDHLCCISAIVAVLVLVLVPA
jgi:hypothetical protein